MLFNEDYVGEIAQELKDKFESPLPFAEFGVDIDGVFNSVDILDLMDYLSDTDNKRKLEPLIRQSIIGKNVTLTLDGDTIGSLRLNNINDPWNLFPVFNDYPKSFLALANVVGSYLLKKSTPPLTKRAEVVAQVLAAQTQS